MIKWIQIESDEFIALKAFMEATVSGFGLYACFTDMARDYAETFYGASETKMLKTEHINGVGEIPLFYKRAANETKR